MITLGSDGSVITEGRCGIAPGDADLVDVPVSAVVAVVDGVLVSVDGVVVADVVPVSVVGAGVVVGADIVGVVGVGVTATGAGPSWANWTTP